MENAQYTFGRKQYKIAYHGTGAEYFRLFFVNLLFTVISLGLYYPWAKAKTLKYLYAATSLEDDSFEYNGTGHEMFKGFMVSLLTVIGLSLLLVGLLNQERYIAASIFYFAALVGIAPYILHESCMYDISHTAWRGVSFEYEGSLVELVISFFRWGFLSVISFGIYIPWMLVGLNTYMFSHIRYGNLSVGFKANGADLFMIFLRGYLFSILTFGIYLFWFYQELYMFYVNNLYVSDQNYNRISMKTGVTGMGFFGLFAVNALIIVFTFGLGYPWVITRTQKFLLEKMLIVGEIELDTINKPAENLNDATQGIELGTTRINIINHA